MWVSKKTAHDACDKIAEISLYAIAFFLPASNRIVEISAAVGILAWLIGKIAQQDKDHLGIFFKIKPLNTKLSTPIFIYLAVNFFSLIFTTNFYISLRALIGKVAEYSVIYFLAVETINSKRRLRNILAVFLISASIVAIDGMIQYYSKVDILRGRQMELGGVTGPFKNQNDLGSFLSFILPISFSLAFFTKKNIKILTLVISFLILICLLATYSRGAWVGAFFGILAVVFIKKKHLIPFFLAGAIIAFLLLPSYTKYRVLDVFNFNEHKISHRKTLWNTGVDMTLAHPIVGQGVGTFMYNFSKYRPEKETGVYYAHNCFLQIAAETGLAGLAAFIWILVAFFQYAFRAINIINNGFHLAALMGLTAGLIAFLIHSAVDTNLYSLPLAMLFWMSLGISLSIIRDAAKEDTLCPNG